MHEVRLYALSTDIAKEQKGTLNIKSNIPTASWTLSRDGIKIATGEGSVKDLSLPPGSGYRLSAQAINNYEVRILPQTPITIVPSQTQTIEIIYKRILGTIRVLTDMPSSDQLTITIEGAQIKEPIHTTQISRGSHIDWKSPGLPLGTYILTIKAPSYYEEIPPMKIALKQGQNVIVKPKMRGANKIIVTTNTVDAIFVLKEQNGPIVQEGRGDTYQFNDLFPGTYTLTFSTTDPHRFIPPRQMQITLSKFKHEEESIYAEYTFAGRLKVTGNIPHFIVKIESKKGALIKEEVTQYTKSITLPEGQWRLTFTPYRNKKIGNPMPSQDLFLDAFETEEVSIQFPEATPEEEERNKQEKIKDTENLYLDLLLVPVGPSILGNPYKQGPENTLPALALELSAFEISKYEVTNGQFAHFLNTALEKGIISLSKENKGLVIDPQNRPLFHTIDSEKKSQISYNQKHEKNPFTVLPGFENYPVIFVTWFGAVAFCDYYNLRLPSESEWERAAAVYTENTKVKKWIYGFSKDTIYRTLANYKYEINSTDSPKVLTTPVGFYNGINTLPLRSEDKVPRKTENAVSGVGAYDMSGNVFEWVSDWYSASLPDSPLEKNYQGPATGTLKVAKGGCYDSLAEGVRSFERISLLPHHADAFTGFRVARTLTP